MKKQKFIDLITYSQFLYSTQNKSTTSRLKGEDALVRDRVATAWANFVMLGNPTPPGSEVTWSPVVARDSHEMLDINGPIPGMTQDGMTQDQEYFENN